MTELAPGMSRPPLRHRVWRAVVAAIVVPASLGLLAVIPASSAYADPSCQNGGVYILFARGTNANSDGRPNFDSNEARTFKSSIQSALSRRGVQSAWAELGNLDNDWKVSSSEYPASAFG